MSYRRQLFTGGGAGVNSVVNASGSASTVSPASQTSSSSSSSLQSPPGRDLPEFNVAILGALGVGKSGIVLAYADIHHHHHHYDLVSTDMP